MRKDRTMPRQRILGRCLARELTRDELLQADGGRGTATTTLISPPDSDCLFNEE